MVQCLLCASSALSHLWWFMGSGRRFSRSRSWTYHVHGYISCCFFKARPIMSCLIYLRLMTSWQYGFESWNSTRFSCNYWFFGEKKLFSNVDFKTISFQFFLRYWWLFLISFIECNFLLSETMCNFSDYKLTKRKTFPYSAAYAHLLEWISCILLHFNVAYAWRPLPPRPLLPTAWRYYTTARRGLRFLRKVWNRVFFSSNFFLLGWWFSVFFFFLKGREIGFDYYWLFLHLKGKFFFINRFVVSAKNMEQSLFQPWSVEISHRYYYVFILSSILVKRSISITITCKVMLRFSWYYISFPSWLRTKRNTQTSVIIMIYTI